jgi:hypothetical protein
MVFPNLYCNPSIMVRQQAVKIFFSFDPLSSSLQSTKNYKKPLFECSTTAEKYHRSPEAFIGNVSKFLRADLAFAGLESFTFVSSYIPPSQSTRGADSAFSGLYLKVVCNENQGGSGMWHTFSMGIGSWRSMFFWLLIFAVIFILIYLRVRQVNQN